MEPLKQTIRNQGLLFQRTLRGWVLAELSKHETVGTKRVGRIKGSIRKASSHTVREEERSVKEVQLPVPKIGRPAKPPSSRKKENARDYLALWRDIQFSHSDYKRVLSRLIGNKKTRKLGKRYVQYKTFIESTDFEEADLEELALLFQEADQPAPLEGKDENLEPTANIVEEAAVRQSEVVVDQEDLRDLQESEG
jgi:hypothetical protein